MTTRVIRVEGILLSKKAPIRYSLILSLLKKKADKEAYEKTVTEVGRVCAKHGYLDDPIIGLTPEKNPRLVVACPWCSGKEAFELWEQQVPLAPKSEKKD